MNLEREVAEWLLNNKEDLQDKITKAYSGKHLYSPEMQEAYQDGILDIIKREIQRSFPLNPEEMLLLISTDFVTMVLGREFLN